MNKKIFYTLITTAILVFAYVNIIEVRGMEHSSQAEKSTIVPAGGALVWSTFLGHSDSPDETWDIAVDSSGIYVIGDAACGSDFPVTAGAYDTSCNGNYDVFVAKVDLGGSKVLWATFLGSPEYEFARGIAVDPTGVYVTGQATSENFPVTAGAYDTTFNGGSSDVFVAKLSLDGSRLIWSTFLGGSWSSGPITSDYPFGLDILNGYAYVCGYTSSPDFPTTAGAYDTSLDGSEDVFATKFNTDGTSLIYSTYLGGSSHENCMSIAVDQSGQAYVTGRTYSTDYPTTVGAYNSSHNGEHDAYVTKLNSSGKRLVYSTFIGGSNWDVGLDLEVDNSYSLYLSGVTESSDFPTSENAYDRSLNGREDVFVLKLNPTGTKLLFSTLLGGEYEEYGRGVDYDSFGNAYIVGDTISGNYPTTDGAFDRTANGSWDAFLARISFDGSRLSFSTYLGGHTWDVGKALVVDDNDYVYITGRADSSTFPVTSGAFDTSFGPFRDAFITKWAGTKADIVATALEITQGIQDLNNNIPLVANRATWARGYVEQVNPDYPLDVANLDARLHGYRNGVVIGSPLISKNFVNAQDGGGDRLTLGDSFLFRIPDGWRTGTVTFTLQVLPAGNGGNGEIDLSNNLFTETLTFNPVDEPCLIMVPVHLHGDDTDITYHITDAGFYRILRGLNRYHPIPNTISLYRQPILYPSGHSVGFEWDLSDSFDRNSMLQRIRWRNWSNTEPEDGCHYVGMVSPDADTTKGKGQVLGLGRVGGKETWVKMDDSTSGPAWFQNGAESLGHELGHNKGLDHAFCSGKEPNTDDKYPWPHPDCAIADTDTTGYYGLTVYYDSWGVSQTVISNDPAVKALHRGYPLMGYQWSQWVSPWEYCKLLDTAYGVPCKLWSWSTQEILIRDAILNPASLLTLEELDRIDSASAFIAAGGWIDINSHTSEIDQIYLLDELPTGIQEEAIKTLANQKAYGVASSYTINQVDENGQILDSHLIPIENDDEDDGLYSFLETVPAVTGVVEVQIREGAIILDAHTASENTPTVEVISPNGGETLSDGYIIQWAGSDTDGDALSFDVSYSPDNGTSWTLLQMEILSTTWQLSSMDAIEGTDQGLIRVVANDGFNTGVDTSNQVFSVPNSPPQALIFSPADSITIATKETLLMEAMSFDNEDGPNVGSVTWSSSIDGFLGDERELAISGLSTGEHKITLSVEDSDGLVGTDSVIVTVLQGVWEIYLPLSWRGN